jgi:hypothetical protein
MVKSGPLPVRWTQAASHPRQEGVEMNNLLKACFYEQQRTNQILDKRLSP